MPAIWSNRAKADTRAAALGAGFGSRPHDEVHMITKPEAAALYALKLYLGRKAIDPLKVCISDHFDGRFLADDNSQRSTY